MKKRKSINIDGKWRNNIPYCMEYNVDHQQSSISINHFDRSIDVQIMDHCLSSSSSSSSSSTTTPSTSCSSQHSTTISTSKSCSSFVTNKSVTSIHGHHYHHNKLSHHNNHHNQHSHRQCRWQSILIAMLVFTTQIVTVRAMLDALKALFILTGASTYLVTKYVNITNRTDGGVYYPDGNGYFHMINGTKINLGAHYHPHPHHHKLFPSVNQSRPFGTELNLGQLNFYKGDTINNVNPSNLKTSNSIRPLYVLAIEEEEDERMLPKLLLKLSISDRIEQEQSITTTTTTNLTDQIEYILDARMDDLAPVLDNFYVNKTNGELFLIKPLDRDPPNGRATWKFSVQARNRNTHFILAVADVLITVRDINDNKPLFEQKEYRTSLMENGPPGQILAKLTAIDFDDADTADNGKVVYSLVKSSSMTSISGNRPSQAITDYFQLDPHTGVLTVLACCFDREKRSEYRMQARATDAGGLSDEATILIEIGDLNDCPPKFINPSRTLVLNDASFHSLWMDQSTDQINDNNNNNQFMVNNVKSQTGGIINNQNTTSSMDENIATFYISDDDLPETNHLSYDIINSTNCSLFHRFYMVVNDDGSGSLYGSRAKLSQPLEYNRTYSCELSISVQDSVRDSPTSSGQIYQDYASLTLIYRNNTAPISERIKQFDNNHQIGTNVEVDAAKNGLPKPRIENEINGILVKNKIDNKMTRDPKASDLTLQRGTQSECSLCENGGQCITTETGYRFRCYCQPGYDGALCERAKHRTGIERLLSKITSNEWFFYSFLVLIVNLLVAVLTLIVWIVIRVRNKINTPNNRMENESSQRQTTTTTTMVTMGQPNLTLDLESNSINSQQMIQSVQLLQQPLMMACPITIDPSEYTKQSLELSDHYVIG